MSQPGLPTADSSLRYTGGTWGQKGALSQHEAQAVVNRWHTTPIPWLPPPSKSIKLVERIENPELWARFQEAARGHVQGYAWHGTSKAAAWRIAHEGFRIGSCKAGGIWFAHDSSFSEFYSRDKRGTGVGNAPLSVTLPADGWKQHTWHGTQVLISCRILRPQLWTRGQTLRLMDATHAYPEYFVHFNG